MSYVTSLENGADFKHVVTDICNRLHRASDGMGQQLLGVLPSGESILFRCAYYADDSSIELYHEGNSRPLTKSDIEAFKLIDRKISRLSIA